MFRYLFACAACVLCFTASAQPAADWLAGTTWVLCQSVSPQTNGRDALVFNADGNGQVIRAQGNIEFRHQRTGDTVALSTAHSQRPVQLVASADHTVLNLRGPDGAPAAAYALQGSAAMAKCDLR